MSGELVTPSWIDAVAKAVDSSLRTLTQEEPLLRAFYFLHLPEALGKVSIEFAKTALRIVQLIPRCPERTVALRKILEGKDAAVRAFLWAREDGLI